MHFFKLVRNLQRISVFKFIFYNYLSKNVKRTGKGFILPYRNAVLDLGKNSLIILHEGNFLVNYNKPKKSKAEAYVKLLEGARLNIYDTVYLNYTSTIEIHEKAEVSVGSAYINSGAVILASKKITIGKDEFISRGVFIYDSDHHPILNDAGERTNPAREVIIEDHVWLGLKCTILRGSHIGAGAMIAADSVVGGKIKPGTMASGNPARSYSEINWES